MLIIDLCIKNQTKTYNREIPFALLGENFCQFEQFAKDMSWWHTKVRSVKSLKLLCLTLYDNLNFVEHIF